VARRKWTLFVGTHPGRLLVCVEERGFAALQPKSRGDQGAFRKLPAEVGQWLLSQVSQYPEIPLKVLYERWTQAGQQLPSLRTIYRFLRAKGYDAASLRRGRLETGPTKPLKRPL
jgi:hypothetical protein